MEVFQHMFQCCSESRKRESLKDLSLIPIGQDKKRDSHQDENHNVNNILKSTFNKNDQDNRASSKNISSNANHTNNNINVSIITFANIKVGESYKTLPEFDTEVMNSHELKLSGDLFWGKDIMLDRLGIKINKRKKRDGVSFFGTSEETDAHGNPINDFIVNLHKNHNPPSQFKSLFSLEYDKSAEHFILKAFNKDINILHWINYNYIIPENSHKKFLIGKIPVEITTHETIANTKDNSDRVDSKITVKVKSKEDWIIYDYNVNDSPITIGRAHSIININNNSISKEHASIEFSHELNCYYIKDKESTNGTFLILEEKDSIQIVNEMKFKILETKFSISEVDQ